MMQLPITVAGPLMMLGVLAVDFSFDMGVADQDMKAAYYTGFLSTTFPALEAIIVICLSTVIFRLYGKDRTVYDGLTLVLFLGLLGLFATVLVPIQEAIASGKLPSDDVSMKLDKISKIHKVILTGMLTVILLQLKSFGASPKDKVKTK